jgi:hypothetical protein
VRDMPRSIEWDPVSASTVITSDRRAMPPARASCTAMYLVRAFPAAARSLPPDDARDIGRYNDLNLQRCQAGIGGEMRKSCAEQAAYIANYTRFDPRHDMRAS